MIKLFQMRSSVKCAFDSLKKSLYTLFSLVGLDQHMRILITVFFAFLLARLYINREAQRVLCTKKKITKKISEIRESTEEMCAQENDGLE